MMYDYDAIVSIFKKNRAIFPHIRQDYILQMLVKDKCFFENGVVIMFNQYKRNNKIGDVTAPKGSFTIKQIVNGNPGNGKAKEVLDMFVKSVDSDIYLSVRQDNTRAISFYKKNMFDEVGKISWKNGTIPGLVFMRKKTNAD